MMRRALSFLVLLLAIPLSFAADTLPPPAPLPGPLVLTGSGAIPKEVRTAFITLAGKSAAKIVIISVESENAKETSKSEEELKIWKDLEADSVVILKALSSKSADDAKYLEPLKTATGVWFLNSAPATWFEAHTQSLLVKELRNVHERGGVIGGRAGVDRFDLLPGFLFGEGSKLTAKLEKRSDCLGMVIDAQTALVVRGRQCIVVGNGAVTLHAAAGAGKPAAETPIKAGGLLDIFQLRRTAANRAAKEPFPPAKPADPVVEKGSLVIVGGGGASADVWKKFIDLAGGPEALIVFVPTALEDPLGFDFVEVSLLHRFGAKNVQVVHTRDRKTADDPKFSEPLTRAKGVWFSGGRQWRFVEAYEGTLTEKRFHEVLARGGAIGGSSAGASIQSEYMPRGHPLGNTVMAAEGYEKGFGFLPGAAIDQHFFARKRTQDMTGLMKQYPQYLGIGIDEGTAIVVKGSTAEVIGKTKVAFYDYRNGPPKGDTDYVEVKTGEKYDMKLRKPVK